MKSMNFPTAINDFSEIKKRQVFHSFFSFLLMLLRLSVAVVTPPTSQQTDGDSSLHKLWSALHNTTLIRFIVDLGRLICTWLPINNVKEAKLQRANSAATPSPHQDDFPTGFRKVTYNICQVCFNGPKSLKTRNVHVSVWISVFLWVKPDPDPPATFTWCLKTFEIWAIRVLWPLTFKYQSIFDVRKTRKDISHKQSS